MVATVAFTAPQRFGLTLHKQAPKRKSPRDHWAEVLMLIFLYRLEFRLGPNAWRPVLPRCPHRDALQIHDTRSDFGPPCVEVTRSDKERTVL